MEVKRDGSERVVDSQQDLSIYESKVLHYFSSGSEIWTLTYFKTGHLPRYTNQIYDGYQILEL